MVSLMSVHCMVERAQRQSTPAQTKESGWIRLSDSAESGTPDQGVFEFLETTAPGLGHEAPDERDSRERQHTVDQESFRTAEVLEFPRENELHEHAHRGIDEPDAGDGQPA